MTGLTTVLVLAGLIVVSGFAGIFIAAIWKRNH